MDIPAPKYPIDHHAYNADLQEALDFPVLDLVDRIGAAGWNKREAFKALAKVIRNQALAYNEDPDPRDDPSEIDTAKSSLDLAEEGLVEDFNLGP